MVWGVQRKRSRLAGALALLGLAFYALLLPFHLTSQFNRQLFAAEFGLAAEAICGSVANAADQIPGAPKDSCPICKGLAAFQLALDPAPHVLAQPVSVRSPSQLPLREALAGKDDLPPRSRGPPAQA